MYQLVDIYIFMLILSGSILILGILGTPIISDIYVKLSEKEQGIGEDKGDRFDFGSGIDYTPPIDDVDYTPSIDDNDDYLYQYRPMNLYRSSYDDPDPDRDDVFRQYDESRRISEDIQQFHNAHPDSDLTDHYSWEDILDAETDGYLDDEDA